MIDDLWYKNAVIYSLDLETFMDGNGDGNGDFEGLKLRLDYLHALGVDTVWLAPFQPSPNRDNGYDISDYYGVDPRHGSSGAFVEFMHQATKRGIKVIMDLVVNHTSDEHAWFRNARSGKDSSRRDWYVWSDKRPANSILLGEANVLPKDSAKYFGAEGNGIHLMFNFYVNQYIFYALATADAKPIIRALEETRLTFPTTQWAHFLRNHDELDLGRLTDAQRQKVFDRFGPEKTMQIYGRGIRRRLASMIGNRPQTELAYSLLLSLPGTPVIRYGDEIGMGDNLDLKERDSVRTPMQWSSNENAGFSTAGRLVHPVIDKGPYAYELLNVETQRRQQDSLLNWMTSLIRLRHECTEIGWGEWHIIDTGAPNVLAMYYRWQNSSLITLHNFDERVKEVCVDVRHKQESKLVDLWAVEENIADEKGIHRIRLSAYGYRWFRSGDLSHLFQNRSRKR